MEHPCQFRQLIERIRVFFSGFKKYLIKRHLIALTVQIFIFGNSKESVLIGYEAMWFLELSIRRIGK